MSDFNNEKVIKKEKKRGVFRLIGIVVPNTENLDNILGYVLLDVKNYKIVSVIPQQFLAMLQHYTFENIQWNNKLGLIESTESNVKDYRKKVMLFNNFGKVIGNHGYTIIAKVISGSTVGYKVLDHNLRIVDVKETDLINTIQNSKMSLLNAKIVDGNHISALKDSFPEIQKEKRKKKSDAQTKDAHSRHLEKILDRFKRSVIDRSMFANLNVVNTFPDGALNDKAHKKFVKDLSIYVKEYAKVHHSSIVEKADQVYGSGGTKSNIEKAIGVMICCMFIDTFINKEFTIDKAFKGFGSEWTEKQLLNEKFKKLVSLTKHTEIMQMLEIIEVESEFKKEEDAKIKELQSKVTRDNYFVVVPGVVYNTDIKERYRNSDKYILDVYSKYKNLNNQKIKEYIHLLPICKVVGKEIIRVKESSKSEIKIKLNMKSQKSIRSIGYCVNESERYSHSSENILYKGKPLRYVFHEYDYRGVQESLLTKSEEQAIKNKSTCLGDMLFVKKLFLIRKRGINAIQKDLFDDIEGYAQYKGIDGNKKVIDFATECIMIILAIYNLDLAQYLNENYKFVNLNLDSIGHEEFPLDETDKIYYQTGGKFNKPEITNRGYWKGLSNMPMGLRTAIALNATNSIPFELEGIVNHLY